jgi:hypothetical protein
MKPTLTILGFALLALSADAQRTGRPAPVPSLGLEHGSQMIGTPDYYLRIVKAPAPIQQEL